MTITKLEHACLVLTKDEEQLVIDPGVYTNIPENLKNVVGIFITHIHPDHLDKNNIQKILATSPGAILAGSQEVLNELADIQAEKQAAAPCVGFKVGNFELQACGHDHAVVYATVPCENRSILIDNYLYYPGDSFFNPEMPVEVLAVPAAAPWLKTAEAVDFIKTISPKKVFPTHNTHLSQAGEQTFYALLEQTTTDLGAQWQVLKPGQSM